MRRAYIFSNQRQVFLFTLSKLSEFDIVADLENICAAHTAHTYFTRTPGQSEYISNTYNFSG